jgi:hypothetical protein
VVPSVTAVAGSVAGSVSASQVAPVEMSRRPPAWGWDLAIGSLSWPPLMSSRSPSGSCKRTVTGTSVLPWQVASPDIMRIMIVIGTASDL